MLYATLVLALALGLLVAGCGSSDDDSSGSDGTAATVSCEPGALETVSDGTLTIATDKPAYPPYFEDDDPTNGEGFESAVAYAIADQLGYPAAKVKWTVEPFNSSYAPGRRSSTSTSTRSRSPRRARRSSTSPAPITPPTRRCVALKDSEAAKATDAGRTQDAKLGVQIGTTSLEAAEEVIDPSLEAGSLQQLHRRHHGAQKRPDRRDRRRPPDRALPDRGGNPRGDRGRPVQRPGGRPVRRLLAKDSPLTDCVSQAVEELESSGELEEITTKWMSTAAGAPVLE